MKATLCCLLCLFLVLFVCPTAGMVETQPQHEFLVLMSFGGTQNGGDEAAFIDDQGGLYYIDMAAEDLYWYGEETLTMLRALPEKYKVGALNAEELQELNRLIDGIQSADTVEYQICACDAGVFSQQVYRTKADGSREEILLMQAGDSIRENMDRNAVALSTHLLDMMRFTHRLCRWSYLFPYGDAVPLSLSYECGSFFGGSRSYTLRRSGDMVQFSVLGSNGDDTDVRGELKGFEGFSYSDGPLAELENLIQERGIAAWDGFDGSNMEVLDGDSFSLTVTYGTHTIQASGYEQYPEGYDQAARALKAYFEKLMLLAQEPPQE